MKHTKSSTLLSLLAGWFALAPVDGNAQTASASKVSTNESAVQMSPFEVNTDKDVGYAAQETLSGTRLRMDLRDVGASLSVLTPEFLEDLGVHSSTQALLYTPSVDTYIGDNTGDYNGAQQLFGNGQRVSLRGFTAGPSSAHDFFPALERNDTYNVEQLTLARGPNALLFGLGGSAGAMVSATKRAQYGKRSDTVSLQTDNWGSNRAAVDINRPLIKSKLALRVNMLHSKKMEFRRYEGLQQDRITLGLRWNPFKNTAIVMNHEEYKTGLNQSPLVMPFDTGALRWAASGRPTVNFVSEGRAWTAAGRTFLDASGRPVIRNDGSGNVSRVADFDPTGALTQITNPTLRYVAGLNLSNPVVNYRWQAQLSNASIAGVAANTTYNLKDVDAWNLFGISKDTNQFTGTWKDPAQQARGGWTGLSAEQKLISGMFLEVAANFARDRTLTAFDNFHTMRIDVDRYLPDGRLNPGYLVPYGEANGGGQYRRGVSKVTSGRATLSYEYDLQKMHRWLGRQAISGLVQRDQTDNELDNYRILNLATAGLPDFPADIVAAQHQLLSRVYYVGGKAPDPLPDLLQLSQMTSVLNASGAAVGATAADRVPSNYGLRTFLQANKTRNVTTSLSLAWIGRFFHDRLVTTVGTRTDEWKLFGIPGNRLNPIRTVPDPAVANSSGDLLRRYFDLASAQGLNSSPGKIASATNGTVGAVFHLTSWLSLTYTNSRNFTPTANVNTRNYLDEIVPERVGTTKDFGVRVYAFSGKLSFSLNRFESTAENESRSSQAFVQSGRNIMNRLRLNYRDTGDSHFRDMADTEFYRAERDLTNLSSAWNYVAEGYEASLTFNPSSQLRIYLSGSSNRNVLGAHLEDLGVYLNTPAKYEGLKAWDGYAAELRKVAGGQSSTAFDLNPAVAADRAKATTDATYIESQSAAQKQLYDDQQALTGQSTHRNGEYAANGMITYTFGENLLLKGFSLGANFRWRSASIVGYERMPNTLGRPLGVINVSRPILGEDYWDAGMMISRQFRLSRGTRMKLQLNVQNLFNWNAARLVGADYDSQGYYGTVDAIVPIRYELRRPREVALSATFTF
jgi:outer membrane receptor protein involved in Fe transport